MPKRYQIWNGTDELYGENKHYTPEEFRTKIYPWLQVPGAKIIIRKGTPFNLLCQMEYEQTKLTEKLKGVPITDEMTPDEVLDAMEAWEDEQVELAKARVLLPSAEERIAAAALEYQTLMALPEE